MNYPGAICPPLTPLLGPVFDVGFLTKNEQTGLDRGLAEHEYPIQPLLSPVIDDGELTKNEQTGKVRGYPSPPYNANVRALGKRLDKKTKIK